MSAVDHLTERERSLHDALAFRAHLTIPASSLPEAEANLLSIVTREKVAFHKPAMRHPTRKDRA